MGILKSRERELQRLLEMVKELELARLSLISANYEEKSLEISNIRALRRAHQKGFSIAGALPVSRLAGADQKWIDHLDEKLRNLNSELAISAAKKEAQIKLSRVALGRTNAFQKVLDKNQMSRIFRQK